MENLHRKADGADDSVAEQQADGPAVGERACCTEEKTRTDDTADTARV